MGAAKTLLGVAVGVVLVARDVAGHAAWYLRYRLDGTVHEGQSDDVREPASRPDD